MASAGRLLQAATCIHQSASCLNSIDWFKEIRDIDWYNEIRLVSTACLITAVSLGAAEYLARWIEIPMWARVDGWVLFSNQSPRRPENRFVAPSRRRIYTHSSSRNKAIRYKLGNRTILNDFGIRIYAWPSKGGIIVLDHTEAVDLEFLGLDPLSPSRERLTRQNDEDLFCQRLLLLGAKWWESEARYKLLATVMENNYGTRDVIRAIRALRDGNEPSPSMEERRWVSVAWPKSGGLWVAEFDTNVCGFVDEAHNLVPDEFLRLRLARTMDERSEILRNHLDAKFYANVRDYKGHAFLNSWEEKTPQMKGTDEVG